VILLEVDAEGVFGLPLEGDPPRTVHRESVTPRLAVKAMKSEPRLSQLVELLRDIERVEAAQSPCLKIRSDS